jgi:hypothetical protein
MHFNHLRQNFRSLLDSKVSIELISAPGRGKSSFIEDTIAIESKKDEKPWGLSKLFLATMTPPDLIGYQFKGQKDFGNGPVAVTEPSMPLWMLTTEGKPVTEYERGILFLDEYGQGEADVKRSSAELLLNRQLGPWKLPPGWSVVAASNRSKDRSGVTKSFDFVINRRLEIEITDDLQSWEDWAFKHGVDPVFITFANQNPQIVFADGVPDKQGPWCTPRSLVMAATLLGNMRTADGKIPTDALAVEIASGMIGGPAAAQMFATIRLGNEMPAFEDIIAKPEKVKVPEKPDAAMLITYNLAARVTKDNAKPVMTYMERMQKEFAVTFAKAACRRDPTLIYSPAFEKWADSNASLMTAIVDTNN